MKPIGTKVTLLGKLYEITGHHVQSYLLKDDKGKILMFGPSIFSNSTPVPPFATGVAVGDIHGEEDMNLLQESESTDCNNFMVNYPNPWRQVLRFYSTFRCLKLRREERHRSK